MNLIEYLPDFLQDIKDYQIMFNSEDTQLKELRNKIEEMLEEVIVSKAKSYGIARYEKIYSIQSDTNSMERRRYNILSKINNRIPYTFNWLQNKLNNTIGKGNYVITQDNNNYKIKIEILAIFKDIAQVLNRDLREQLSANMEITVNLFQTEESKQYFAGIVHTGDFIEIRQVM